MNIKTICRDENNFIIEITEICLDGKQYENFRSRIKGRLSEIYGRRSMIFQFVDTSDNTVVKMVIPNGYLDDYKSIEKAIKSAYSSMELKI